MKIRGCRLLAYVGLLVAQLSTMAHASLRDRAISELQHTVWLGKDGAPSGITSLAQTPDGFLWLGTEYGLIRFDGVRYTQADENTGERYPSETIQSLFAPRSGGVWVGLSAGTAVILVKDGKTVRYQTRDARPLGTINDFAAEENGNLWIASVHGLCELRAAEDVLRCDELDGIKRALALYVDRVGTLWVSTGSTLYARRRSDAHFAKIRDGFGSLYRIRQAPDGRFWLADIKGSVQVASIDDQGNLAIQASVAVASAGLSFDADGGLWITTLGKGLRRIRFPERVSSGVLEEGAPELERFAQEDGLSGNYAWPVLVGREGETWIGTSAGVDRFQPRSLIPAGFPAGAHDFSLAAGEDGAIWAGTTNYALMKLQGRNLQEFKEVSPEVNYVHRDQDGGIWIGASDAIYRVEDGRPVRVAPLPVRAGAEQVRSILIDRQKTISIALNLTGAYQWEGGSWTKVPPPQQVPPPAQVWAQTFDRDGRLWRAYNRGFIAVVKDGQTAVYSAADGLNVGEVRTLARGHQVMWVGGSKGLAAFDGGRFRGLVAGSSGELDGISGIVETASGDLWLRSVAGLLHYNAEALRAAFAGEPLRGERFDHLDGLPGQSAQVSPLPTLIEGTDHRLWLATGSGVVWIDPSHPIRDASPPMVRIESFVSGEQHLPLGTKVTLPQGLNRVQINYTAAALQVPERTKFRYRLDGVDTDWQDAGTRREALYNNLAPAAYRFQVTAADEDGTWNPAEASLVFEVPPLFYQTWWFRSLTALIALVVLFALFHRRMRHVLVRVTMLHQERMIERERIARELHDTLLQGVQGLILRFQATVLGMQADDPVRGEIEGTLVRANRILEEGRDKVMGLRSVTDCNLQLEQAWSELAVELSSSQEPAFELTVEGTPRELMPLIRDEVHRIGAEAIINAFRHAQARRIDVEIGYASTELRVRIRDDGRGIADEVLDAGRRSGHWGLPGMSERATWMHARLMVWSKPGVGTEIELRVPGSVAYGVSSSGFFGRLPVAFRGWSIARKGAS
jgi:signal transduction histidine kinase/ligand-binding sensor domain-containing protein